jgi:DNA-directed RNA polymerase specialized sigma24 family protein
MGKYVEYYCQNNEKELRKLVDKLIQKGEWGWIPKSEYDEIYSFAAVVVWKCEQQYDDNASVEFSKYLAKCILNKIKSYARDSNRLKRKARDSYGNIVNDVSLEQVAYVDDEGIVTIEETLASDFDIDNYVDDGYEQAVLDFIDCLPNTQREIVELIMEGYSPIKIRELLEIDEKAYSSNWKMITSYTNVRELYKLKTKEEQEDIDMGDKSMPRDNTSETYCNKSYSIDSICKQLRRKKIKDNHILQRNAGQWKSFAKSELVSDILRGKSLTQIIIDEEIKAGIKMQWLIDGKQRCTVLDDYMHDGFAISKNVKNYNISYQVAIIDEDGDEVLNDDGFPKVEIREFDIREKKFSQLPEELQEVYKDRQIPVLYNMNCTKKDIADDIARFNRSRPMNISQLGWLGLEEGFAELAEGITKMAFFEVGFKGSSYTKNNHDSGIIRRIVVESIMVSDFLEDYNKDFASICDYLTNEASDSNFTFFYSLVERLTDICDESVSEVFNSKSSFLWFGLFSWFDRKYDLDDLYFICFVREFIESLHEAKIDNVSFDDLNTKGSKDKTVVTAKINHLESLMDNYFKEEQLI